MTRSSVRGRPRLSLSAWTLVAALAAALIAYIPTFDAPLYSDDYIYLDASKQLSFARYARLSFTPWSHDPYLPFTRDFWRPLSFLYFEIMRPVFGGHVMPYHVVNVAIHLSSVVLVWVLARRMDPRPAVAATAAVVFAVYPGSTEAVSWISSINSAGLPLALGAWALFLAATEASEPRWRTVAVSVACFVLALMFRETSAMIVVPLGLWYVLVQRRDALRSRATYAVLVPFAVTLGIYYVIRTRLFTEPAANPDIYGFHGQFDNHWWFYIKNVLLPFRDPVVGWRIHAQEVSGVLFLAFVPLALFRRKWGLFALLVSIPISIVPTSAALLGAGQRYFYFSTPVLALAIGIAVAETLPRLPERLLSSRVQPAVGLVILVLMLVGGGYSSWDRNDHWEAIGPDREEAWARELRAEYPALPSGGILYCVHVPLELVVYEAANLLPTARYYYPDIGSAVWVPDGTVLPPLGPKDRVFIAGDGLLLGDTRTER